MGIAEVVPGVSGGTIAFVSGIYDELVGTLAGLSKESPLNFFTSPVRYWNDRNLTFLLVLGLGMIGGIFAFAHVLGLALESAAPVVWAFFFGLILASAVYIGRPLAWRDLAAFGAAGVLVGLAMTQVPAGGDNGSLMLFFLGGVIAVCAWLLPAVSGSFMLLALGLYAPVLAAVSELRLDVLASVAAGCAVGLLLFSRLLSWLLARFRSQLLSLLCGFMVGALPNLWPWQIDDAVVAPAAYSATGSDAHLLAAVVAALAGVAVLRGLVRQSP